MGEQIYLERFVWFDNEARHERFPNASKLGEHFEIASKTAQRSLDHFRDRLQAPLEYYLSRKGYYYTDPTFQLLITRISEEESLGIQHLIRCALSYTSWHLGSTDTTVLLADYVTRRFNKKLGVVCRC